MSVTRSKAGAFFRFLASLRFALILLALIAAGSLVGTLIRQGAEPAEYAERYPGTVYKIITLLNLDDVYHAPWFYFLIALFAINLTLCTVDRLRRFAAAGKEPSVPTADALLAMDNAFTAQGRDVEAVRQALGRGYRMRAHAGSAAVFERGGLSRYGVYVIHGSIILILLGSLIGLMAGYRGFMMLWEGETKDRITLRGREQRDVPLGFAIKCNRFQVAFYPTGEPKDFMSRLAVIDGNRVIFEKEIRVNDPLEYKGFRVYQATYGSAPVFQFSVGGEKVALRENEMYQKGALTLMPVRYRENIHDLGPGVLLAYVDNGEPRAQWFLKNVEKMRENPVVGVAVRLDDIRQDYFTGLEIAKDPGVWVVWTGFGLILLGLYITFFVHLRRIYVRVQNGAAIVAGFSPKNRLGFAEEMEKLKGRLHGD